uniref:Uncharacterized protein n=1 Tax=Caenorhabditis japonica TaxID=281687 RepID=A0A8R1I853_CAEJA
MKRELNHDAFKQSIWRANDMDPNPVQARIPSRHIYYYRSAQHNDRWILSFAFIFESPDAVRFAYCIPYTYGQMQKWLAEVEARKYPFFHRDLLTYSVSLFGIL